MLLELFLCIRHCGKCLIDVIALGIPIIHFLEGKTEAQ